MEKEEGMTEGDIAPVLGPIGSLVEHAYSYAGFGLEVFPVNPKDKTPLTSQHQATVDLDSIEAWWSQWPEALIGHRTAEDVVILDIDPRHGGLATWQALKEEIGESAFPVTRVHYSGRGDGGGHAWWMKPDDHLTITKLDAWAKEHGTGEEILVDGAKAKWVCGIDLLRRNHRYSILPPSLHPETGQPYNWAPGRGLGTDIAPMPQLLVDLLVRDAEVIPPRPPGPTDPNSPADWYSTTHVWGDLLRRHGWLLVGGDGESDGSRWRHPTSENRAHSATIRHGCLFVYSPNTPFEVTSEGEPKGYTLFKAWATLEHLGDMSKAAAVARRMMPKASVVDLAALAPAEGKESPFVGEGDDPTADFFVSWSDFWTRESLDEEWLIPEVIALGRAHVIYAGHKQGKSLYTLWSAAQVAIEREDVDVIYLDYEMTQSDLRERLEDMGHGPEVDFSRLHYALLPMLAPLDTLEGARELLEIVTRVRRPECHVYVVIDTMGRAVEGEENSNDTTRAFYRYTGSALKRAGVTWARLDHAGKDATKGQRGGSAKGDDVDVIWKLIRGDDGIKLHCDAARMSWVPQEVVFRMTDEPLTYTKAPKIVAAGVSELIEVLDRLGVSSTAPLSEVSSALRGAGCGKRKAIIVEAQKARREVTETSVESLLGPHNSGSQILGTAVMAEERFRGREPIGDIDSDQGRNRSGTAGTAPPSHSGSGSPPIRGNRYRDQSDETVSIVEIEASEAFKRGTEKAEAARRTIRPEDI